jgi:acylphosphatase
MPELELQAKVKGLVQGVFFRANVKKQARALGLTGLVRNEQDGTVLVVAQGEESQLQCLIDYLRSSPGRSAVREVECSWEPGQQTFADFSIRQGG